jgi:hypothetical protein
VKKANTLVAMYDPCRKKIGGGLGPPAIQQLGEQARVAEIYRTEQQT